MGKWNRFIVACVLSSTAVSGCQRQSLPPASLDTVLASNDSLSPEDRVKRSFLERILRVFQEGVADPVDLQLEAGSIDFQESIQAFYAGHKRLIRFEFDGPPQGDLQHVVLTFDDSPSGPVQSSAAATDRRAYRVFDNGNGVSIVRVP